MRIIVISVAAALLGWPTSALAQDSPKASQARDGYFRAVSEHFRVSLEEVRILGEWRLSTDEIPVVLFVASRTGVSPDAVARRRGDGQAWDGVARSFDLGSASFHVALPSDASLGILARAYEEFASHPRPSWDAIRLRDQEIIALVNIHFLSVLLRVPPEQVLDAAERAGTFVGVQRALGGP